MGGHLGVKKNSYITSKQKASFCSNESCCVVFVGKKRVRSVISKILVSFDLNLKKCPCCNSDLFVSNYNKKTTKKEYVND